MTSAMMLAHETENLGLDPTSPTFSDPGDGPPRKKRRTFKVNLLSAEEGHPVTITRKSVLATFLRPRYRPLTNIFRLMAEGYTILRRDALNLGNMHLRYYIEHRG